MAVLDQFLDSGFAYEAGGAGDEDTHYHEKGGLI